ncbi:MULTISPECIES: hypothetical protein [unclassified Marinitoga]|uniref:hypothetical protein n=1 Tax=unclassified Marinitoga TaxID=2640159 RepID=UPI001585ED5D|nr:MULTISPECIES: hypothetical protein [unclassified Marinitoga]
MERIKVKNFIVLKNIDIELKRLNVFIGKQENRMKILKYLKFSNFISEAYWLRFFISML